MLLHPNKKNTKRLRDILFQLYGHLDSSTQQGGQHEVSLKLIFFIVLFKFTVPNNNNNNNNVFSYANKIMFFFLDLLYFCSVTIYYLHFRQ